MALMTYNDGLNLLKSALDSTRGILQYPNHFLYIAHAYSQGWLENNHQIPSWKTVIETGKYDPFEEYEVEPVWDPLRNLRNYIGTDEGYEKIATLIPQYCKIVDAYYHNTDAFLDLYKQLGYIPYKWWHDNWAKAFDDLLLFINEAGGLNQGVFTQPKELTNLITFIRQILSIGTISLYDPFAGVGQFLTKGSFGGEINDNVYCLGRLRMLVNEYSQDEYSYYLTDSIKNWEGEDKKFDLIVSFPPLGLRIPAPFEMNQELGANIVDAEEFLIYKGINSLMPEGRLIGIFSNSILSAAGVKGKLREKMINDKKVQMVIQLPPNLLSYSNVQLCVIVFDNSATCDNTLFIDASSLFTKEKRKNKLNIEALMQLIIDLLPPTPALESNFIYTFERDTLPRVLMHNDLRRYGVLSSQEEIIANDCLLQPNRFLLNSIDIPDGYELVPLNELVTPYSENVTRSQHVRLIRGKDLSGSNSVEFISFDKLPIEETQRGAKFLNKDCILVQLVRELKPTLYRKVDGDLAAIPPTLSAIIPNEGIDPYYLVLELKQPYVKEQVDKYNVGGYIPTLRREDLYKIQVLIPTDRTTQHSLFLSSQRNEFDEIIKKERERLENLLSIRRHRIKPYLSGLKSNITLLMEGLSEEGCMDYSLSRNYTVQDALENMDENLTQLKLLFNAFTINYNVGTSESINLHAFLKDYSYTHTMPDVHFIIDKTQLETIQSCPKVIFNKKDLKEEVLDEIIHNAEKHFKKGAPDCRVAFILRYDGKNVNLLICNNGTPVPDDFDEELSFQLNYSYNNEGTGIGLYRVRQICDEFGAQIQWENDPENLMPTGLCITFKLSED